MRCDLHVHTIHSGMCTVPVARHFCRESYNTPAAVYEKLKLCGMDLVTITDHDSIDAAESLRQHPDFFLSEEATCRMPSGREVHIGIYGITEGQHIEIQRRRDDFYSLLGYVNEQRLLFSINHLLSALTGPRDASDFIWFESVFPCMETQNGAMPARTNRLAADLAARMGKSPIGGSDAHTMRGVGSAFTIAPGARNRDEFLQAIRAGKGIVQGESGGFSNLTCDVWSICAGMMKESPWTAALAPLLAAVPAVILVNCLVEALFAKTWFDRIISVRKEGFSASWDTEKVSA